MKKDMCIFHIANVLNNQPVFSLKRMLEGIAVELMGTALRVGAKKREDG